MTNEKNYEPVRLKCNGATKDFPFDFQVHKNSKTLKYNDLIVTLIKRETKEETILTENSDYTINASVVGGNVTTNVAYSDFYDIEISRKSSHFQEKNFSTSSGFQASEIENAFDRISCSLQDMDYNIETFKSSFASEITTQIQGNKEDTDKQIENFEDEINSKLTQVNKAAEKLSRLDEIHDECQGYAISAEEQAIIAQNQAVIAAEKALETEQAVINKANIDLDNLSEEGIEKLNEGKLPVGAIFPCICSAGWTPENTLPCNGAEYAKSQFSDLWEDYLTGGAFNSSAFATVGNPNLTPDGIASGLTNGNNYVRTADSFNFSEAETWEITTPIFTTNTLTDNNWIVSGDYTKNSIRFIVRATGKINFSIWKNKSVDATDMLFSNETAILIENNKKYKAKIGYDGSGYYLKLSVNGADYEEKYRFASTDKITYNPQIYFGKTNSFAAPDMTMDLKEFAVKIDGEEVVNGSTARLATCTYAEYAEDISNYGQCAKFAVDTTNNKFKVPTIKDGAYITQALSDTEIGKAYKESLPNITGTFQAAQDVASTGAFQTDTAGHVPYAEGDWYGYITSFSASRSSSTYQTGAKVQGDNVRLRYFVVVATGSINQSAMDWSAWATSLNEKIDKSSVKRYVVEKSSTALLPSWYTVYSDGWIEQGCHQSVQNATVNFLKPFTNVNYTLLNVAFYVDGVAAMTIATKTLNGFSTSSLVRTTGTQAWYACGY